MKTYIVELTEEELDFLTNKLAYMSDYTHNKFQDELNYVEHKLTKKYLFAKEDFDELTNKITTESKLYDGIQIKLSKARFSNIEKGK